MSSASSADAGFTSLAFSLDLTNWGQDKWGVALRDIVAEHALTEDLCQRLIERGRELGVRVAFWNVLDKYSSQHTNKLCPWPYERLYVSSDMRVVPCCIIANPAVADLGNAENLVAVWHGEAYETFRRDHREGRIPEVCRGCYREDEGRAA